MKKFFGSRILAVLTAAALFSAQQCTVFAAGDGGGSFVFSDTGIQVSSGASGYETEGTSLTVDTPGTYTVSGKCANGSIKIKKGTTGVTLILYGLELTSEDTAPLVCGKSSEVTVTASDGTENTLTDTEYNNDDEHPENENAETAVIKCKDGSDVTLCGSGTLNINANGKNGIKSGASTEEEGEASLSIEEITLNINAPVNDGINAEAYIAVKSGSITVDAGDDGIHCDLIADIGSEGGGPEINITGCCEGLEAAELNMYSGNIRIYSEDDCLNAANSDLGDYDFSLLIAGGALYMYSVSGDGIDSNGSLTISGGVTEVWTANTADNHPLDADGTITVTGGTVFAAGGSAGMGINLSSSQANVRFGSASIGGGDHGSFPGGRAPPPPNGSEGESFHESGELTPPVGENGGAPQRPDGDSEDGENPPEMTMPDGSTSPSDGTFPEAPENPSDGATPPEKPDGGDMPSPRENQGGSTPPSGGFTPGTFPGGAGIASSLGISEGSEVVITSSDGTYIYSATAPCTVGTVFFSSSALAADETYTLFSGSTESASAEASAGNAKTTQDTANSITDTEAPESESTEETAEPEAENSGTKRTVITVIAAVAAAAVAGAAVTFRMIKRKKTNVE